jgi:hypothetical protein
MLMLAIAPNAHAATRHVFYFTSNSTITTYNVDPTTGTPSQVGSLITIAGAQWIANIVPTPNDHFIYVFWPNANNNYSVSVYATNSYGVPQTSPVQTLSAQGWQMMIHNSGKYAYVLKTVSGSNGYSSTLYLYHIDPTTGVLTKDPTTQAKYGPDYYYTESLVSFNKGGTRLYDLWSVGFDGENNYYYSYHPINGTTGQLSPDVGTIFSASNYAGVDEQYFTSNYILNLDNQGGGSSVLNVYSNVKNPKQPLFTCTQSMLNACGTAQYYYLSVDEQYVFLPETSDIAIGRIDGTNKVITETGTIPTGGYVYLFPFGRDNQLIYGDVGNGAIQVYVFDSVNGTVASGGSITFNPATFYSLYSAIRQ